MLKLEHFISYLGHAVLLAAMVAMGVSGCALGPTYQKPETTAPADWTEWHSGAKELTDPQLRQHTAVRPAAWWQTFNDPMLNQLMAEALGANQDLQIAALHFSQSRAQRLAVAAQQGSHVDGRAGAIRQKQSENGIATRTIDAIAPANRESLTQSLSNPYHAYEAGFDASWELDMWGRVRRSIEAADADVQATAAALAEVQLTLQAEVVRRYFELRGAQQQLRIARAQVSASQESLDIARVKARNGLIDDLGVTQQEVLLSDQRSRLPQLLAQEAQTMSQITLLLGKHPGALQEALADQRIVLTLAALPDLRLGVPSELARRRPDIQRAEAQLHSTIAGIGIAMADLYPRLTLGASFGLESTANNKFGDWGSTQWSIGPSLSIPIFDQGRRRALVQLRELQQQEAAVVYQQTLLKAWHEVDDSLTAYSAERQRYVQLADKVRSSTQALKLAQTRYRSGLSDYLGELDARRSLLQADREETESGSRLFIDLAAIYKALGGSI